MKLKEKEKARELRKEGLSLKEICLKLGVAKSSVSGWVKDIELTEDQLLNLKERSNNPYLFGQIKGVNKLKEEYLNIRKKYQNDGRKLVKECDKDFVALLMLYWAEGTKSRNSLHFSNGDYVMMKYFLEGLRKYFYIRDEDITFRFQWYSNNTMSLEEVKLFWLNLLNLNETNMRKCFIDYRPIKNIGNKINKLPYGVGSLSVHKTEIVQKVYGAIQEFIGFENSKWIE